MPAAELPCRCPVTARLATHLPQPSPSTIGPIAWRIRRSAPSPPFPPNHPHLFCYRMNARWKRDSSTATAAITSPYVRALL